MIRPLEGRTFPRFRVRPPRGRGFWRGNPSHGLRRGLGTASPRWTPQAGSFEVYKQNGLLVIYRAILFLPCRPVAYAWVPSGTPCCCGGGLFYRVRTVCDCSYNPRTGVGAAVLVYCQLASDQQKRNHTQLRVSARMVQRHAGPLPSGRGCHKTAYVSYFVRFLTKCFKASVLFARFYYIVTRRKSGRSNTNIFQNT